MSQAYHNPGPLPPPHAGEAPVAVRRRTGRCSHPVVEVVPGGYIVRGVRIDADDVAPVIRPAGRGAPLPARGPAPAARPTRHALAPPPRDRRR